MTRTFTWTFGITLGLLALAAAVLGGVQLALAASTVSSATLNGTSTVSVAAGSSITASVTAAAGTGADRWRSTGWRIGTTSPGSVTCVDTANVSNATSSQSFTITAPTAAGTYDAYFIAYSDNVCADDASATFTLDDAVVVAAATSTATSTDVVVTIHKYIDGAHATSGSATSTFPMQSSWSDTGFGSGSGTFSLAAPSYRAETSAMDQGADYSTSEQTTGATVGASCAEGKHYALVGYSSGTTEAAAAAAPISSTSPSFSNLTEDRHVIVHNTDCTAIPEEVTVTIAKYLNGSAATASSSGSASFPMRSSWDADNLGGAGSGAYALSPAGFNTTTPYQAVTAVMDAGSSYATNEDTSTSVVGTSCTGGAQFRLLGYSTGASLAQAASSTVASTSPSFSNLQGDRFVIVWNETCGATTTPPTTPPANACDNTRRAPAGFTLLEGTGGNDTVTLAPNTMYVAKGGNDTIRGGDGNYIVCAGGGNDTVTLGNGNSTVDTAGGNDLVTLGNGGGTVITGGGNDRVTVGSGAYTISTAGGNDTVSAGDGAQTIETAGGNDTIRAGAGDDIIRSGSGNDTLDGGAGTDTCDGGSGNNTETACEL